MEFHPLPGEDGRAFLQRLAAEAAEHQRATVEAAQADLRGQEQTALDGLAGIVEQTRKLPPQNKKTLGPLWPGNNEY